MRNSRIISFLLASVFSISAIAQAPPQGINYQAVAVDENGREIVGVDAQGEILPNKEIAVRFTILQDNTIELYQEEHTTNTDQFGLFNLTIGFGNQTGGTLNSFSEINWGIAEHFLRVELDINNDGNFISMGSQQMMSVPYALYAETAGSGGSGTGEDGVGIETTVDNGDGTFTFTYTDGSTFTTSNLQGPVGPQGPQGNSGPQGPQGAPGANGIGINWLGTLTNAPSSPSLNDAYYNSTQEGSFIWNGNTWQILAQDGTSGSGGANTLQEAYNEGGPGAGRVINANNGAVEINATGNNSQSALEVNSNNNSSSGIFSTHNGTGVAIRALSNNASNASSTIQSETNTSDANTSAIIGSNSGAGFAVAGQLPQTATGFAALFGNNLRTNGGSGVDGQGVQGVSGQSFVTGGTGVFGLHNNPTLGVNPGAQVPVVNAGLTGLGFYGTLGQSQLREGVGVFGFNSDEIGSLTEDATGVTGNGGFVGVLGTSQDGSGYGIASLTNSLTIGNLEALGAKTFVIDHPTNPQNKLLKHAAVESNQVLNIYRGNIICDSQGNATIELPAYFKDINIDFSYILTPVGGAAPNLHVAEEVSENTFKIAGALAGMKVSWQVTAQRNDIYMQDNPFQAEVDKPSRKTGKYLYPKGYGLDSESDYISTPALNKIVNLKEAEEKQKTLILEE